MASGEIQAFVLGAGLGTRLRPLTEFLPKPLVPVCNRPLINYAFDHLMADLGVSRFLVNTHHCPDAYSEHFPDGMYRGNEITFRHEPVLLDTAGGIDNVRDWLPKDDSFVVYNGDILTDLPLGDAWRTHLDSGNAVTMVLRSEGDELRVGYDPKSGQVVDLRGVLKPDWSQRYQFTGIYFVAPHFLPYLKPGEIESVVLPILEAIKAGERVGGVLADGGTWSDLGERDSYLSALEGFEKYNWRSPGEPMMKISPEADIAPGAEIDDLSWVGPGASIGENAQIKRSIIWGNGTVAGDSVLDRVIVRSEKRAEGHLYDVDL
ncbi:MAG: hypothetical protein CMO55_11735 [Verrucomicrobiales bacterium]|nr:hypothetical protein [Verrucomicrobiales bacterium]